TVNNKGSKQEQSSEGKIIKKSNNDGSKKLPDNKKLGNSDSGKDLVANSTLAKGKAKSRLALDSIANNKESNKEQSSEERFGSKFFIAQKKSKSRLALDFTKESKEQTHENKRRLTMNKSFKAPAWLTDRDKKSAYQEFVCGRKPNDVNDDKSNWFRQLPWDERLKNAYDQGKAIMLHNVDPDYTSSEIEDIVWHTFNEKCTAKILQCTALSSPHYGQAIILLNKKEAAQKILVKLDEE
nr:protein anti-silencing 1-like [Tanacetum cinerariifolium]